MTSNLKIIYHVFKNVSTFYNVQSSTKIILSFVVKHKIGELASS